MCTVGVVSSIWGVTFPLVLASVAGHFASPHHRVANAFAIFVEASLHGGVVWQGLPASYALPAAGKFLERLRCADIDQATSSAIMSFARILSKSYQNLDGEEARDILKGSFGPILSRWLSSGGEQERMEQLRSVMLEYLRLKMHPSNVFSSLEPSNLDEVSRQTNLA